MSITGGKITLAQQLVKGGRVAKLRKKAVSVEEQTPDIEDIVPTPAIKSIYFSPTQTHKKRSNRQMLTKSSDIAKVVGAEKDEKKQKDILEPEPEPNVASGSKALMGGWEPEHWQQMLENIRQMRAHVTAPVDTMGCDKCADDNVDDKTRRFQKLVALMLSSQTKDQTTFEAIQRLKSHELTPSSIRQMEIAKLEQLLYPVSFYKNKAKYLQQTASILVEKYKSDIPNNAKELIALPGVGPKMAHICMATAWNETTGIGVDVHVHRIANRLRWLPQETKEPEKTRIALENWLPRELWREINSLLVGFGQTICTPVRPHCGDCLNSDTCPSANKKSSKSSVSIKSKYVEIEPIKKFKFEKNKLHL